MALELIGIRERGEYLLIQCALDERLGVPFFLHKSDRREFHTEEEFQAYLTRQTRALLEEFGDARQLPYRGEREADA